MVDEDGNLKPTAFPTEELTRQTDGEPPARGCSVIRHGLSNSEEIAEQAAGLMQGRHGRLATYTFSADTSAIRTLLAADNDRSLCVVDRAIENSAAHAELWGGRAGRSKGALKAIRDQLAGTFRRSAQVA